MQGWVIGWQSHSGSLVYPILGSTSIGHMQIAMGSPSPVGTGICPGLPIADVGPVVRSEEGAVYDAFGQAVVGGVWYQASAS